MTLYLDTSLLIAALTREAETDRVQSLSGFPQFAGESFVTLPLAASHFRTAARFAGQHALGLRAGDALHLAVCANYGATLCTLDRRLAEAAPFVGVATRPL